MLSLENGSFGKMSFGGADPGPTPPGDPDKWTPNPSWWNIEQIIKNDTSGNRKKYILLLSDSYVTTTFTVADAKGFKTSDGAEYTGNTFDHTWDITKDKQCVENGSNVYKTRWVMVYFDNSIPDSSAITLNMPEEVVYVIIDTIQFNIASFGNKRMLESVELLNGANLHSGVITCNSMFYGCYSLRSVPPMDTSNVTNTLNMFYSCYSLPTIPFLNTSKVSNTTSMFNNCYSLRTVPLLDMNKVTNATTMFSNCHCLTTVPLLDTSNVVIMSNMFSGCYNLKTIPFLDVGKATSFSSIVYNNYALRYANLKNITVTVFLTSTAYGTNLSPASLVTILNGLADATGRTAQTLTLGETNLNKLTSDEKAIAINKNWILN